MTHIRLTENKVHDLTKKGIDPADKNGNGRLRSRIYRDDKVRGLFIEVGLLSASYKVQSTLRKAGDRPISIRKTLGRTTDYSLEQARRWAEEVLGTVRRGEVPTTPTDGEPTLRALYKRYAEMRDRQGKDTTHTGNIQLNARTHLGDWLDLKVSKITQPMVEARHTRIGEQRGPYAANHTIKQLRAVLNSHPATRKANPVEGIVWFKPKPVMGPNGLPETKALRLEALPSWWKAIEALDNDVRCGLHKLALLSGMRYGHLVETQRSWVDLDAHRITFPKLKRGRPFALPLSPPMLQIVKDLMALNTGSPFLFWAESKSGHIEDWREKELETGHCLRHTYISIASKTPIPQHHREMLVDHAVRGMHGHYTDMELSFPELLEAQEQISKLILGHSGN